MIRRANVDDTAAIKRLVVDVVSEVYGDLMPDGVPDPSDAWEHSLIAVADRRIVAVGLCKQDRIEDLWLAAAWRGRGIGAGLLARMEGEIAERGFQKGKLRVVARNDGARRFYRAHGWYDVRTYVTDRLGWPMVDMEKSLTST